MKGFQLSFHQSTSCTAFYTYACGYINIIMARLFAHKDLLQLVDCCNGHDCTLGQIFSTF